jgi:hypothetical protein
VLANLLTAPWTTGAICDAIVHEAIHALVYRLEIIIPLFTDSAAAAAARAESPWSGRSLDLLSLVHACFVWFGLWTFWTIRPHAMPEAIELRNRAEHGFLGAPLSARLAPELYALLQPEVQRAIEEMFQYVKSRTDYRPSQHCVA